MSGPTIARPPIEIHLISDSTGDTAARVARAARAQFAGHPSTIVRHPRVLTVDGLEGVYAPIAARGGVVVLYTLIDRTLRRHLAELCIRDATPACDLLGGTLEAMAIAAGHEADYAPGRPVGPDADYFKRVAAMEFAVAHDDGRGPDRLSEAEIVLIGVSRTGKTPLSMYLGYLGYRTANIPLVHGVTPPPGLFEVPRERIVGLTLDPERLTAIRGRRARTIGAGGVTEGYAELASVLEDLDHALAIQRRLGCPVLDVTELAIEESAVRVLEVVESRTARRA